MNPILFKIGSFQVEWYSFLIVTAVLISFFFVSRECKKFKIEDNFVINILFWTMIFGIIGARLWYVAFNWSFYSEDLLEILKVWNRGLAIHGAVLFGLITVFIYCKKYKANTLVMLDIMAPFVLLSQAIGRWGNFFNGEAFGSITTYENLKKLRIVPEFIIAGMNINGNYYLPMFYFESLWCIIGFIILMILRKIKYTKIGQQIGFYLMWYSVGRFFIEHFRTDSLMWGYFKVAQLVSILLFIVGLIITLIQYRKPKLEELYNEYIPVDVKNF